MSDIPVGGEGGSSLLRAKNNKTKHDVWRWTHGHCVMYLSERDVNVLPRSVSAFRPRSRHRLVEAMGGRSSDPRSGIMGNVVYHHVLPHGRPLSINPPQISVKYESEVFMFLFAVFSDIKKETESKTQTAHCEPEWSNKLADCHRASSSQFMTSVQTGRGKAASLHWTTESSSLATKRFRTNLRKSKNNGAFRASPRGK